MSQKYSRQRESIRENLMHRTDHPTADMVYSDIRRIYPNVSLGTVYRNLALLSEQGEISKITTTDGILRYDRNTSPHSHFVCRKCGMIFDLEPADTDGLIRQVQKDFTGWIESCEITFSGMCGNCGNQDEKSKPERMVKE